MYELGITTKYFSLGMFLAAIVALVAMNLPQPAPQTPQKSTTEAAIDAERLANEVELLNLELDARNLKEENDQHVRSFYVIEPVR